MAQPQYARRGGAPSPPRREVVLRAGAEPPRPTRRHRWSGSAPAPFRTPASPSRSRRSASVDPWAIRYSRSVLIEAASGPRGGCVRAELL